MFCFQGEELHNLYKDSRHQYFWELDKESRPVELRLHEYFRNRGYLVIDRRDDEFYRLKDIDFEIHMQGQKSLTIEVKADKEMYKTGNFLVEFRQLRPYRVKNQVGLNIVKLI